ncbi:MAG: hypothetical protein MI861_24430 [Pirellulales bacterium]|nr:hypothetical protein [Pirellulales bacterium]
MFSHSLDAKVTNVMQAGQALRSIFTRLRCFVPALRRSDAASFQTALMATVFWLVAYGGLQESNAQSSRVSGMNDSSLHQLGIWVSESTPKPGNDGDSRGLTVLCDFSYMIGIPEEIPAKEIFHGPISRLFIYGGVPTHEFLRQLNDYDFKIELLVIASDELSEEQIAKILRSLKQGPSEVVLKSTHLSAGILDVLDRQRFPLVTIIGTNSLLRDLKKKIGDYEKLRSKLVMLPRGGIKSDRGRKDDASAVSQ